MAGLGIRHIAVWAAITLQMALVASAGAEGLAPRARASLAADGLPFARSERAQRIWDSGACWSHCGAYCAWGQAQCLRSESQSECLSLTDRCDRLCQRTCRSGAGPYLPIE